MTSEPIVPLARPSTGGAWIAFFIILVLVLLFWLANAGVNVITALAAFILFVGAIAWAWLRLSGRGRYRA